MTSYKEFISRNLSNIGISGGGIIIQRSFQNVTQNDIVMVEHGEDTFGTRIVQVVEQGPGTNDLVNTSLDFDPLDEVTFVQEDSINGTDFVDGSIRVHSPGVGFVPTTFDPNRVGPGTVLSNGNKTIMVFTYTSNARTVFDGVSTGKYYWEIVVDINNNAMIGIYSEDSVISETYPICYPGRADLPYSIGYYISGDIYYNMEISYNGSYGDSYTTGDVIGIALDCDNNTINFSKNGAWIGQKTTTSGKVYFPAASVGGTVSSTFTSRFDSEDLQYTTPDGFISGFGSNAAVYVTTKPYYITTSDSNQIDMSSVTEINFCTVTSTIPDNTSIKCLVSFDDRSTWQKWSGLAWAEHLGGLTNLQTGNTITEFQNGFTNLTIVSGTNHLDFAFDLGTIVSGSTPEIDQIIVNYDEDGAYVLSDMGIDYSILYFSSTQTKVTKDSAGTENIKVNILL